MPGSWETIRKESLGTWWDINFVHAISVRMSNGTSRVMLFSYGSKPGNPWATNIFLWDGTNSPPVLGIPNPTTNLLCAGHCQAGNGKIVFAGGHWDPVSNAPAVPPNDLNIYDAANPTAPWSPRTAMHKTRWYPTCTTLPDGKILITYGFLNKLTVPPVFTPIYEHEVFDPSFAPPHPAVATTLVTYAQNYDFEVYPYVFVLPNGHVLFAGPKRAIGTPGYSLPRQLLRVNPGNPSTWVWDSATSDYPSAIGNTVHGSMCMFDAVRGKILTAGGVVDDASQAHRACAIYNHEMKDWGATASMHYRRRNHNLVCLPDESVLAVGGNLVGDHVTPTTPNPQPVLEAEIFKPWLGTSGQWERTFTTMTDPRYYHSTAILLRDARVLTAGGEIDAIPPVPPHPSYAVNSAQIFRPPYLDNDPNRPSISASPTTLNFGQQFAITLSAPFLIGKVTMTRLGAVTHGFDQDQRCVKLLHSGGGSTPTATITATAPANANIAPPGHYFLWVISNTGVPCLLAAIVKLG
jgi:Domain of unknown function (DUF1929)